MDEPKAMTGCQFWWDTDVGKELAKIVPPKCTRVIIDLPVSTDLVKIYYETIGADKILKLNWAQVAAKIEAVSSDKVTNEHEA